MNIVYGSIAVQPGNIICKIREIWNYFCCFYCLNSIFSAYFLALIESGCPPKVLQKLLGHTDISITLNTYCDAFDSYVDSNLAVVDKYFQDVKLTIT